MICWRRDQAISAVGAGAELPVASVADGLAARGAPGLLRVGAGGGARCLWIEEAIQRKDGRGTRPYLSEANITYCVAQGIDAYLAMRRKGADDASLGRP